MRWRRISSSDRRWSGADGINSALPCRAARRAKLPRAWDQDPHSAGARSSRPLTRSFGPVTNSLFGDVQMVFQITPGTEAPAEMNFYLPQFRALFMAENANLTMHNLLPARGALVRDCKAWADYLTEAIRLFGERSDVMFAAHGIPRFGQPETAEFLASHRDAYKFLHDQTIRLINTGLTASEIAEVLELPAVLAREWFNRGYYGTMSHNSKAIYQRYLGWYDANPANLNPLPPEPAAKRYVAAMGGAAAVRKLAAEAAREALAAIYTTLGLESEAGTWRNIYLTGAQELRGGPAALPGAGFSP